MKQKINFEEIRNNINKNYGAYKKVLIGIINEKKDKLKKEIKSFVKNKNDNPKDKLTQLQLNTIILLHSNGDCYFLDECSESTLKTILKDIESCETFEHIKETEIERRKICNEL